MDGIGDPYTRFITPQQFEAMAVYDVTGVGMNLGSTDEYSRKVGFDRAVEGLPTQVCMHAHESEEKSGRSLYCV